MTSKISGQANVIGFQRLHVFDIGSPTVDQNFDWIVTDETNLRYD